MNEKKEMTTVERRLDQLAKQRQEIMSMPAEQALEAITSSPEALPLVHSFAEDDLYLLIHDIGPEDALPILSMASDKQWEYILDIETWEKDAVSLPAAINWLNLLMTADSGRLTAWLLKEKTDLLELTLFRNIVVMVREHDEDPSVFGTDAITFDDVYYFKFIPHALQDPDSSAYDEKRKDLILKMLKRIAKDDYSMYGRLLTEAAAIIPAETEEELFRLRGVRMAEKGFLPFEEAIGIYQPLGRFETDNLARGTIERGAEPLLPVSLASVNLIEPESLIARTLDALGSSPVAGEMRIELASLFNRVIVADQRTIRERTALADVVRKTCGYLSIGLHRMADLETGLTPDQAADDIQRYPLATLFRIGYDRAMKLKQKAETWKNKSWFVRSGLPISFWDEDWVGVLGGLLVKQPRYFDNYATGVLYRDFQSAADIRNTGRILDQIAATDELLDQMAFEIPDRPPRSLTYKNLLLTAWARGCLDLTATPEPIPRADFLSFFNRLLPMVDGSPGRRDPSGALAHRTVPVDMKQSFLDWVIDRTGSGERSLLMKVGFVLDSLFNEIESEYGGVRAADLDPRYIHLFMVRHKTQSTPF